MKLALPVNSELGKYPNFLQALKKIIHPFQGWEETGNTNHLLKKKKKYHNFCSELFGVKGTG